MYHLDRGYEALDRKLNSLGARIERVTDQARRVRLLRSGTREFERFLEALIERRHSSGGGIDAAVAAIIAKVRRRGDRALIEFTARFDGVRLTAGKLRVKPAEMHAALAELDRG